MHLIRWLRDRLAGDARGRRLAAGALVSLPDLAWLAALGAAVLVALMWFHFSAWAQAHQQRLFADEQERPDAG